MGLPAGAATLSAADLLNQFSVITAGNLETTGKDNYGRAYVGGDLDTSAGRADFGGRALPGSSVGDIVVEGDVVGSQGVRLGNNADTLAVRGDYRADKFAVDTNGFASILAGGTIDPGVNDNNFIQNRITNPMNNGQPVQGRLGSGLAGDPDFNALFPTGIVGALTALSSDLSGLTGATSISGGQNGILTGSGFTVYNLTAGQLSGLSSLGYSFGRSDTVVINVAGSGTLNYAINNNADAQLGQRTLWNFTGFDTINIGSRFVGALLAPGARLVTTTDNIEGSIFASSAQLNGQTHAGGFTGELPIAPVPLPAGIALVLTGLGALELVRRRKRCTGVGA